MRQIHIISLALALTSVDISAEPCDPDNNPYGDYHEIPFFGCQSVYHFDFTVFTRAAWLDMASFGEGTDGAGGVGPGPSADAGPSPDAGPATDAGPSADAGGDPDGGDSGDGDGGEGGGGCAY